MIDEWLKSGRYLPSVIRDFHAQKQLFKTIHHLVDVESIDECKDINWISAHIYVIDVFLWWMARRGYTLQKSRQKFVFRDLQFDINEVAIVMERHFASLIKRPSSPQPIVQDVPTNEQS